MLSKPKNTKKKKIKTPTPSGDKQCFACGCTYNLEVHHCMPGNNRNNSSIHGCVSWLCSEHHRGTNGVHNGNKELDTKLKKFHQSRLEANGMSREEFINLFGRSYL